MLYEVITGHPVEQQAQAPGVAGGDEAREAGGVAEARGGRVQAQRLVAPGAVERVLGDGQQLQVGEAQVGGGTVTPIAPAETGRGASWGPDDTIVFAPRLQGSYNFV